MRSLDGICLARVGDAVGEEEGVAAIENIGYEGKGCLSKKVLLRCVWTKYATKSELCRT